MLKMPDKFEACLYHCAPVLVSIVVYISLQIWTRVENPRIALGIIVSMAAAAYLVVRHVDTYQAQKSRNEKSERRMNDEWP